MTQESEPISGFRGEYSFLRNPYPVDIRHRGFVCPSVEHAYQISKTFVRDEQKALLRSPDLKTLKAAGRRVTLRSDWEQAKVKEIFLLLKQKFSYSHLAVRLLATGDRELIEDNTWGDRFWGVCNGEGENWLGRLLMGVRGELRGEKFLWKRTIELPVSVNPEGINLCSACQKKETCPLPSSGPHKGCIEHWDAPRTTTCRGCYRLSKARYFATECRDFLAVGATEPAFDIRLQMAVKEGL